MRLFARRSIRYNVSAGLLRECQAASAIAAAVMSGVLKRATGRTISNVKMFRTDGYNVYPDGGLRPDECATKWYSGTKERARVMKAGRYSWKLYAGLTRVSTRKTEPCEIIGRINIVKAISTSLRPGQRRRR